MYALFVPTIEFSCVTRCFFDFCFLGKKKQLMFEFPIIFASVMAVEK